ncbi:MAG TPA: transglycosylase domain-containing protein, partial [Nocardioides sp.]|uniref:transglycosylase domain-containing protein n=1 Tax=Nocardioides sp. TaxID=35761 RepID=UPI002CA8A44F
MSAKRRAPGKAVTRSKAPRSTRRRLLSVAKWGLIVGLVAVLMGVGAFVYVYRTTEMPDPNADFLTQTTKIYYADGSTELGSFATQERESISLDEMPQTLQDAVISAEDRTFWTNRGIDPRGILRAAFNNASGGATQGASTITQQYVKILYLTSERSLQRKLKEAVLSLKIQREQSKQQILEGYLNTIYFGRGAYGVQAAANAYFDHPAGELTLKQSAVLASVLNSPTALDPANGKEARQELLARYRYVLSGMAEAGDISQEQADRASRRLPAFPRIEATSQYGGQKGHMLKLVRDELHALGYSDEQIDGGGLRVTTTFTPEAMAAAGQGVSEAKPEGFGDKQLHIGVASVEPATGALRGFYAGQDYLDSQINWAVAGGMVGSTFKPVTLAAALEDGFSLKDTFEGNSPYEFPDGLQVRNEGSGSDGLGNDYGSAVSAVTALEESINTAFVDMSASMDDGPAKILQMANRLGIPPAKPSQKYPGIPDRSRDLEADGLITLGKARISPVNMANAYATVAAGGERAQVHVIEKVEDRTGETSYTFKSPTRSVLDEDIAADVSYAMQQVVQNGTGTAALALGRPAAGKTGTATNDKDQVSSAWFVGYTPQLATAVMYVRGDGDDQLDGWLPSYFGADYPARTWTAVMSRDMEGLPVEQFPEPAYVDGDAPSSGHAPYVPPPRPTGTRKPPPSSQSAPPSSPPPSSPTG